MLRIPTIVCVVLACGSWASGGESGPYVVQSNGKVATVAYKPDGTWKMTDEDGRTTDCAVGANGEVGWGGKVLPEGNITFQGNQWVRVGGLYRVASNGKTARIEGLPDGRMLLVDEHGKRAEASIHGQSRFDAFGQRARIELKSDELIVHWEGNLWVKGLKPVSPALDTPKPKSEHFRIHFGLPPVADQNPADQNPQVFIFYEQANELRQGYKAYVRNNTNSELFVTVRITTPDDKFETTKKYTILAGGREFLGYTGFLKPTYYTITGVAAK